MAKALPLPNEPFLAGVFISVRPAVAARSLHAVPPDLRITDPLSEILTFSYFLCVRELKRHGGHVVGQGVSSWHHGPYPAALPCTPGPPQETPLRPRIGSERPTWGSARRRQERASLICASGEPVPCARTTSC